MRRFIANLPLALGLALVFVAMFSLSPMAKNTLIVLIPLVIGLTVPLAILVSPTGRRWACKKVGCERDWPDMDRCWRCDRHIHDNEDLPWP